MPSLTSSDLVVLHDYLSSSKIIVAIAIALFAVFTHWSVWDRGVFAMGWNTSVTWLALGVLLLHSNTKIQLRFDWIWLLPLALLALSFGLYENPWLKMICVLVMPITVGMFFSFGHLNDKHQKIWGAGLVVKLISNTFKVIPAIPTSFGLVRGGLFLMLEAHDLNVMKRVIRALLILIPLMFVILLLLSSADQNFDAMINGWFSFLCGLLNWSIVTKVLCIALLSSVILAVINTLRQELNSDNELRTRPVDDLIASIILVSILFVYIAFLRLQLDYLLVKRLPIEFSDTERLVKSGFWQLFFLSIINVGLFYWAYKNTGPPGQWVLRLYLIASALILISAGWRMSLYVFYYGLSYEKFFASYTTLYALILFGFLGWAVFAASRKDIVKILLISSLWMFSIANVLPIERIIFSSNAALFQSEDSRIDLFHLTHLSTDVLASALSRYEAGEFSNNQAWVSWLRRTATENCDRPWYETNLSVELNCSGISVDDLPTGIWKAY